jgi:hypothetical protein
MKSNTSIKAQKCPSSAPTYGASLLGVVRGLSSVDILPAPVVLDAQFFEAGSGTVPLDAKFRFLGKCAQDGCKNWYDNRCMLIEQLLSIDRVSLTSAPECAIRSECRWFDQSGERACRICPTIVRQQPVDISKLKL